MFNGIEIRRFVSSHYRSQQLVKEFQRHRDARQTLSWHFSLVGVRAEACSGAWASHQGWVAGATLGCKRVGGLVQAPGSRQKLVQMATVTRR